MKRLNPISALINTVALGLSGRIHFPRNRVGQAYWLDGEKWVIFREVQIDPRPDQPQSPGAIFRPRFHVSGMSVRVNILFSWIPAWFILGLPGLRSKLWLVSPDTGDFSGYYEWDTVRDAENYARSFAAGFMTRRSIPGSVSMKVIPQADICQS
jgi:hypothetical protein